MRSDGSKTVGCLHLKVWAELGKGVFSLTLGELAALARSGEVEEGPIAEFAADYREASRVLHKKDD
jgi:hypothetical protein